MRLGTPDCKITLKHNGKQCVAYQWNQYNWSSLYHNYIQTITKLSSDNCRYFIEIVSVDNINVYFLLYSQLKIDDRNVPEPNT